MTIQEKINLLTTNLSANEENLSSEEIEDLKRITRIASEYFIEGAISTIDPEMLLETYEKFDTILDAKIALLMNQKEGEYVR